MRIREATPADVEAVRAVHAAAIRGLGPAAYDDEQVAAWAKGTKSADYAVIEADDCYFVVAEVEGDREGGDDVADEELGDGEFGDEEVGDEKTGDGEVGDGGVVAFGSLLFESPESDEADVDAEITGIYVHPSAARDGVGTAVLDALERRARERGVGVLGLTASLNAVPFYEAHGYERVREHAHEFSAPSGVEGTVVEMTTEL